MKQRLLALAIFLFVLNAYAQRLSILNNPFQYDSEYKDSENPLLYLKVRYVHQPDGLGIAYFTTHDFGAVSRSQ